MQFTISLQQRLLAYELVSGRFSFLQKLDELPPHEILTAASNLVDIYKDDLDACLGNELVQFAEFFASFKDEQAVDVSRENFMYKLILDKQVQGSFPNVEIVLRMYLVLMISNCTLYSGAFVLKDEINKEQTSYNDVQRTFVSPGSDEYRV